MARVGAVPTQGLVVFGRSLFSGEPGTMLMTQIRYVYGCTVYYRARYYDPAIGRFISEDPIGFSGGTNFYAYVKNTPTTSSDPFGLRDVRVLIWNNNIPSGTVGHVEIAEMDGTAVLSQFPDPHDMQGKNTTVSSGDTLNKEGSSPNYEFIVHVPDDKAFDAAVAQQRDAPNWDWMPYYGKNSGKQTNCVKAGAAALKAGGVPVGSRYWWPGGLGDDLLKLSKSSNANNAWRVTTVSTWSGSHP